MVEGCLPIDLKPVMGISARDKLCYESVDTNVTQLYHSRSPAASCFGQTSVGKALRDGALHGMYVGTSISRGAFAVDPSSRRVPPCSLVHIVLYFVPDRIV